MTKRPQNIRVLITGSTGRLGRLLRAAWEGWGECPIEPIYAGRRPPAPILLGGNGPLPPLPECGTVIALWGLTTQDPVLADQNVALAHRSREVARALGARRVIHLSSAAVYGPGTDLSEASSPTPGNAYGTSKLAMEKAVAGFADDDAHHICLRLANVVGADSLRDALLRDGPAELTRYPDGHGPTRSYIAPGDLARLLATLAIAPPANLPDILNVAAPDPVRMEALLHAAGRSIIWRDVPASPAQHVCLDTTRLARLLPAQRMAKTANEMIQDWRCLTGVQ